MDPMDLATWAGGALLVVGAVGALYRIVRGPSLLDRAVATDVLLVVFAGIVGFVGSVTVARFAEDRRPDHSLEDQARVPGTTDVPGGEEGR